MSDFFQLFQPGLRHLREQRDLDKVLVVDQKKGGTGPRPLDFDSGTVVLRPPTPQGGDARPVSLPDSPTPIATPPPPVPDTRDWTVVLTKPCAECGFDAAVIEAPELADLVRRATAPWNSILARRDAAVRPAPRVWSALEYGCHVRDLLGVFTARLVLMLEQTNPDFADWDQDAAAIEGRYWEQDPALVAAAIATATRANVAAWERVGVDDWARPGRRSNGSAFTVDSLGRYLLHDLRHHLADVGV